MSEDEYWQGEYEDDEFGDVFLIDEPDDIDIITIRKFEVDIENVIDQYAKVLRKCKTLKEAKDTLLELYIYAQTASTIENDIRELQNRAKNLEFMIEQFGIR